MSAGDGFTADELELIQGIEPLSPDDKNTAGPAGAGDAETSADEQDPIAQGVDADRVTGWAIFDTRYRAYVPGSRRLRPPTDKMRADLERPRFEWHRV